MSNIAENWRKLKEFRAMSERERVIAELLEAFVSYSGTEKQIAEAAYDRGYKAGVEDAAKEIGKERERSTNEWFGDLQVSTCDRLLAAIRSLAEGEKP